MRKGTGRAHSFPKVRLPAVEAVTLEEVQRRRDLFVKVMKLREQIGPIGIPTDELIRQVRAQEDEPED